MTLEKLGRFTALRAEARRRIEARRRDTDGSDLDREPMLNAASDQRLFDQIMRELTEDGELRIVTIEDLLKLGTSLPLSAQRPPMTKSDLFTHICEINLIRRASHLPRRDIREMITAEDDCVA